MGERKGTNLYYPPDFDPKKHGSLNAYHGTHALRERARKLDKGILIIRFELPYNIWCGGCGNHVGMGVRYNAEKTKVGSYYTTPIYRFKMKCHLCDNRFEIETDPKNCDYVIVSGARRKEERWEPSATETIEMQEKEEKEKLMTDAMFKLEHGVQDKVKLKAVVPTLSKIAEIQTQWRDDFTINQLARKKFREEKKEILLQKQSDEALLTKGSLDIKLLDETDEDIDKASRIRYKNEGFGAHQRKRRREIKFASIFGSPSKASEKDPEQNKKRKTIENRLQMKIGKKTKPSGSSFDPVMKPKAAADKFGVVAKPKPNKNITEPFTVKSNSGSGDCAPSVSTMTTVETGSPSSSETALKAGEKTDRRLVSPFSKYYKCARNDTDKNEVDDASSHSDKEFYNSSCTVKDDIIRSNQSSCDSSSDDGFCGTRTGTGKIKNSGEDKDENHEVSSSRANFSHNLDKTQYNEETSNSILASSDRNVLGTKSFGSARKYGNGSVRLCSSSGLDAAVAELYNGEPSDLPSIVSSDDCADQQSTGSTTVLHNSSLVLCDYDDSSDQSGDSEGAKC